MRLSALFCLSLLLALPAVLPAKDNALPTPRKPVAPDELLGALPREIDGWQLTTSRAANDFSGWERAEAKREFTRTPAEPGAEPAKLSFQLIDTGYFPAFNGVFVDYDGGTARFAKTETIEGLPAIESQSLAGNPRLTLWIAQRYILRIEQAGAEDAKPEDWVPLVDTARLSSLAGTGDTKLSRVLNMYVLDELNPKRSSKYKMAWTPQEEPE